MKKSSRRKFLFNSSLAATGALVIPRQLFRSQASEYISCGPDESAASVLAGTVSTVKSGNWSDPATWGGSVPSASDTPAILAPHAITFDMVTAAVTGMNISKGATLLFHANKSTTLESTKNILLEGTLVMNPSSPAVIQTIRFTGINEDDFVGAGMVVLESDIGLWVMGSGTLNMVGSPKTSWTRAQAAIPAGAMSVTLSNAPEGWLAGDDITIAPTEPPTVGEAYLFGFEDRSLSGISASTISFTKPMERGHPMINNKWTAEVMNLTRNVRVQGTPTGNSHIFIKSGSPQTVKYAELRYMGPRKDRNGDGVKDKISGRYGIHFHHSDDGSRGSLVEGCVVRDTANNAYVPHVSHGVTLRNNVAYNVTEPAFWWDEAEITHDTLWENNIVALNKFVVHSLTANDDPTFLNTAYELGKGDNNIALNNVAVGIQSIDSGAYDWEANNDSVWKFSGNMAHNSQLGIRVWQNNTLNHVLENFTGYHNFTGISHGAYANSFKYNGGVLYGNLTGIKIEAASTDTNRVRFENMLLDGAGICEYNVDVISSPLDGAHPLFFRNMTLKGHTKAGIRDASGTNKKSIDVIECDIAAPAFNINSLSLASEVIRVQPATGQAFKLSRFDQPGTAVTEWNASRTNIANFAPTMWGSGTGLLAEYYNSVNFTDPAFTRVDSTVSFYEWSTGVNYAITGNSYSVRWTGFIQPQYSEAYTFYLGSGGGHRLWIDNQLVIDSWQEHFPDSYPSAPVAFVAGQQYAIKLEYFNTDSNTGMGLLWSSTSQEQEYVPQTQLYVQAGTTPPTDPTPPVDLPAFPTAPTSDKYVLIGGTLVTGYINVKSSDDFGYRLYDISGRLLLKGKLTPGINYIPAMKFSKGMLLFNTDHGETFKLIKL